MTILLPFLFLFLLSPPPATAIRGRLTGFGYIGKKVGARTPVQDVGANREIQDLGRFSVSEYNRMRHHGGSGNGSRGELVFSRVVEAERQVVAGVKYYLKIEAAEMARGGSGDGSDSRELFESVVVVRPWDRSKVMLDFEPSSSDMIQGS
ncbi:hypothetical protein MLD38_016337 [Melastoma candidum]|uniref:Uncharacterized protein n=1 Tax=Melastoma candidum TaxID=119954 RepID=A0ACB9RJP8_9MYRT|nr:hypothetical protein MLD38_016337 [Melastoma candidum]